MMVAPTQGGSPDDIRTWIRVLPQVEAGGQLPLRYFPVLRSRHLPQNVEQGIGEDVPSSVELRRRPGEHHAALTCSSCMAGTTFSVMWLSSAVRSAGRCRWPLARRNCLPYSTIPAAHQRSAICPSRERLTLSACSRHTEIIDSMQFVDLNVRARVGGTPRRSTVSVWSRPSRRLAAAPG